MHVGTASRALNPAQSGLVNPATRARVVECAARLGYRPNAVAQSLRNGTTSTVGVVVADLANPYFVQLIRGIEAEARPHGVMPLVVETHDDSETLERVVTRLIANRIDSLIVSAAHMTDEPFIAAIEAQVPTILAVRTFLDTGPGKGVTDRRREVLQDDAQGARIAAEHLIGLGHRRIAQLRGDPTISSFVGRSRGYLEAIAAAPGVCDVSTDDIAGTSTIAEGRRIARRLLVEGPARDRPTAIFAHNDLMALGAIDAVDELGLSCPEDVSVVGYNDAPLIDHAAPPLSTVRLPSWEIGRHSARLALSGDDAESSVPVRIMLTPEFVVRSSTTAPPARLRDAGA